MWRSHPVGVNVSRYYGVRPEVEQKTASATLRVFHHVVLEYSKNPCQIVCYFLFVFSHPTWCTMLLKVKNKTR